MKTRNGDISMKTLRPYILKSLAVLDDKPEVRRATTFVSPKITVKVTKQRRTRANARQKTFLISVGTPNFLERRFLKTGKAKKFPLPKYELFTGS